MNGGHDLGGVQGSGRVEREAHEPAFFILPGKKAFLVSYGQRLAPGYITSMSSATALSACILWTT